MKYILITLATATSLYTSDQRFATPRPRNQFEAIAVHNLQRKAQSKKPKVQSFPKKKRSL